jgi:hypothetical protein
MGLNVKTIVTFDFVYSCDGNAVVQTECTDRITQPMEALSYMEAQGKIQAKGWGVVSGLSGKREFLCPACMQEWNRPRRLS